MGKVLVELEREGTERSTGRSKPVGGQEAAGEATRAAEQVGARVDQMDALWLRPAARRQIICSAQADDARSDNDRVAFPPCVHLSGSSARGAKRGGLLPPRPQRDLAVNL